MPNLVLPLVLLSFDSPMRYFGTMGSAGQSSSPSAPTNAMATQTAMAMTVTTRKQEQNLEKGDEKRAMVSDHKLLGDPSG